MTTDYYMFASFRKRDCLDSSQSDDCLVAKTAFSLILSHFDYVLQKLAVL